MPLKTKPTKTVTTAGGKEEKQVIGPSNLSAVCAILRQEAARWTHVWQIDSASDFGSGQQRQRLWGLSFRLVDLQMSENAARDILNSAMNSFSGIQPCHPEEYLLHDSSRFLKDERTQQVVRTMETAALVNNDQLNLERLFETGGVFVISNNGKKRRLKKQLSDSSPSTKWVAQHQKAFRDIGQDLFFGDCIGIQKSQC